MAYDHAVMFYIISLMFLLVNFYFNKPFLQLFTYIFAALAIASNALQIFWDWQHAGIMHFYALEDVLMLLSLSIGIFYLILSLRYRKPYVGFFLLPIATCVGIVSLFLTPPPIQSSVLENRWLYMHIPFAVIGTAFFLTAFAAGIMYFVMEKQLKEKKFGRIFDRFPPLAVIDRVNNGALYLGFAFYTVAIFASSGWARFKFDDSEILDSAGFKIKVVLSFAAWLVFGAIILIKGKFGMNARQTALASVIGFLSVLATYIGVVVFIVR
ncbi:MAG: cytochrome c biogenesis protein [Deferribacteraceae bacterium]|jgi:ABC-type uncharacterized transport system permease subunit|nr:cytochrome c biogenesis protein [Deferribacteraceae bacterium]